MTVIAAAGMLLPVAIGLGWLICVRNADGTSRGRLLWVVVSLIGIIAAAFLAAHYFAQPTYEGNGLSSKVSFAALDGLVLAASAVLSILVFTVLLFLSGTSPAPDSTHPSYEPDSTTDTLRRLGDDW